MERPSQDFIDRCVGGEVEFVEGSSGAFEPSDFEESDESDKDESK